MDCRTVAGAIWIAVAVGSFAGRRAQAQTSSNEANSVTIGPSPCSEMPWSSGAWIELLRVELANEGLRVRSSESTTSVSPKEPTIALVPVVCGDSATSATLIFSSGGIRRNKTIDLTDVQPVARPRVLAIAMADMVRQGLAATKATEGTTPPPRQELDVRIQLDPRPEQRVSDRSWAAFAVAETKLFSQGNAGLFGVRAGAIFPLGSWLRLGGDVGLLAGTGHDALGDIDETMAALGASLFATGGNKNILFGVGPRVEAGIGWFRAHAANPLAAASDARSAVAFLALSGMAIFHIDGSFSGLVGLDVGTSLYGFSARADQRHVSDLVGPVLGARVGFVWSP